MDAKTADLFSILVANIITAAEQQTMNFYMNLATFYKNDYGRKLFSEIGMIEEEHDNNCSHQAAYKETGMQGVSYTTGVPAMIGAMMFLKGIWRKPGVWNVEQFDPDPFMEQLNKQGLPWHEEFDKDLEV